MLACHERHQAAAAAAVKNAGHTVDSWFKAVSHSKHAVLSDCIHEGRTEMNIG